MYYVNLFLFIATSPLPWLVFELSEWLRRRGEKKRPKRKTA